MKNNLTSTTWLRTILELLCRNKYGFKEPNLTTYTWSDSNNIFSRQTKIFKIDFFYVTLYTFSIKAVNLKVQTNILILFICIEY